MFTRLEINELFVVCLAIIMHLLNNAGLDLRINYTLKAGDSSFLFIMELSGG